MKTSLLCRCLALVPTAWLLSSCATVSPQETAGPAHPRYRGEATTDMVLQFYKWDSIYMTKPDTREGGFLPLYARDDIGREVKGRNINRSTAAVVISLFYRDPEQLAQLSREWTAYLTGQGFQRVVVLQAGPGNTIDGLPVLSDSAPPGVPQPAKVAYASAAVR